MLRKLFQMILRKPDYAENVRFEVEQFKKMAQLGQRLVVMEGR